jgi:hypothetical protein
MSEETNRYFKRRGGLLWLWAGVSAGPLAIAMNQQLAYYVVTLDCSYRKGVAVMPVMLISLVVAAAGAFISWRNWQRAGRDWEDSGGDATSRSRFLAIVGLLFSVLALLAVIAMWLATLFYRQCER